MNAKHSAATSPLRVALATCPELPQLDTDTHWLVNALQKTSVQVDPAVWDDQNIDWEEFDLVVVRSCWDYASRRHEFLAWAERVPHLANPASVLAWNTNKQYLSDLAHSRIPVIPTTWIGPDDHYELPDEGEWVIKPAVSIASMDTGRYQMGNSAQHQLAVEHVRRLQQSGRMVMMQPYMAAVDTEGETAMVFLGGEFSHALSKGAILDGPDAGIDRRFQPSGGKSFKSGSQPRVNWNLHNGLWTRCLMTGIGCYMLALTLYPRLMDPQCSWNLSSPNRCSILDRCLKQQIGWLLRSWRRLWEREMESDELKDESMAIERSLWKNEPDVYGQTYIPEAILIFPEVGRMGRSEAVDAIREENKAGRAWAEVNLDDVAILKLGDETVLLTYRAAARWNYEKVPTTILCSTLYVKREGHWRVALHQQT